MAPERRLGAWLAARARVVAVTGAGVSTASGIPDYRDGDGQWKRRQPVTYQAFVGDDAVRHRYWARSFAGWTHFSDARPNAAHRALAQFEHRGVLQALITQNVDRLHQRAGSHHVIDLHGRLDRVICLACRHRFERAWLQQRLAELNPEWADHTDRIAPDGDADIENVDFSRFIVPDCPRCGGMLKPDVVFYGESVPTSTRDAAAKAMEDADGVLVAGSSLMVWSSFRLVRAAAMRGVSIAAVNQGRTRADDLLDIKCSGDCGAILQSLL
ncbi:MAG TPA: NAD-dependent protein deacetylase [Oleiagrimonas sp.]|nr:NAD-dependent protein deacetylase [Oleiagrimonas sp.]